jgi:hypothetical protein
MWDMSGHLSQRIIKEDELGEAHSMHKKDEKFL